MNRRQKIVLISGITIVSTSLIIWISYGSQMFTKTQILIEKKDELFPDMIQREWVNKFIWGLDLSAAISGISLLVCIILYFLFRTKAKQNDTSS